MHRLAIATYIPVSIHAPVRGGDFFLHCIIYYPFLFQSTPPCEGATFPMEFGFKVDDVSIHAPVRGGDPYRFVSRLNPKVSIHAPVRGGDMVSSIAMFFLSSFNPRPRARGRLPYFQQGRSYSKFQSTPPCEGATGSTYRRGYCYQVSIHAPVRGGDPVERFNPRPRARGRQL